MDSDDSRFDLALGHALQLDGRAPFSKIAAVLEVSDHTVARRYARLRSAGRLRVRGLPDPWRLGRTQWSMRIECMPSAAGKLAEALARRPDTAWISLNSGGTQVFCALYTERDDDGSLLLETLPSVPRVTGVTAHCVVHKFFGNQLSVLNKTGVLTPAQVAELAQPTVECGGGPVSLDADDRRLFAALAQDGRAGLAALAAATGWSQTTVRRRMAELRDAGILFFDVDFDLAMVGLPRRTLLWLSVAPDKLAAAGEALALHQQTAFVAATTGVTNLYASLATSSVEALYEYVTTSVAALPGIQHLETAPVIRTFKSTGVDTTVVRGGGS